MNYEEMTAYENSKKCEIDEALSSMSPDDFFIFFFFYEMVRLYYAVLAMKERLHV